MLRWIQHQAKGVQPGRFGVVNQPNPGFRLMSLYLVPSLNASTEHPSFAMADAAYAALRAALSGPELARADHAFTEQLIHTKAQEILLHLFEGWANQRVAAEIHARVTGADGQIRTHHRERDRSVECIFGTAVVTRDCIGARGTHALAPGDAALNLPDDRFSFGVRHRVAEAAANGAFEEAAKAVVASSGAAVVKRQAEELAMAASVDFDAFYREKLLTEGSTPPPLHILVLSVDGKGIVMRPEGLRPATREAAKNSTSKLQNRLSEGEKKNRKRMATVATVYTIEPQPRTPEDIIRNLDRTSSKPRPRAQQKRVFASVLKAPGTVIGEMFDEATRRDPGHKHPWVALVDGNRTQIQEIRRAAKERGVEVTLVLDIIHAIEYLWAAAWEFYSEGDTKAEVWVGKYLKMLLCGRATQVAGALRRSATAKGLKKRDSVEKAAGYFLKNKALMRYDEYLRNGLPIATGVIEGACRHLVKDRMDITGARWGLEGAEAVLRLRSLKASGDLAAYWPFHHKCEFERNHASNYVSGANIGLGRQAA